MIEDTPQWLERLEEAARSRLPEGTYAWVAGGAGHEDTLRASAAAWRRLLLRPDALTDVSVVDTATTVLGAPVASPVAVAPSGFQGLSHPDAEIATARAAAARDTLFVLSSRSSLRIEEVSAQCRTWWYQSYVLRDRALTAAMVERAASAGAAAIALTVDAPALGRRRRNRDPSLVDRASLEVNTGPVENPASLEPSPAVTAADIEWLRHVSGLPVVVKGVLRGDTATRCVDAGAGALWVSNHGGRQLDGAVATATALVEVVDAVADRVEVYVDGGVSSGTDVLRALALGARAVFLGRPPVWGLVVDGEAGVAEVLARFQDELVMAMRLSGRTRVADLARDLIAGLRDDR